jgi:hypothetical protein
MVFARKIPQAWEREEIIALRGRRTDFSKWA